MNFPIRNSGDRPQAGQNIPAPDGGPLNLVRRLLRREDSAELPRISSLGSAVSPKPSMVERLEGFFTQNLRSSMEVLPTKTQEPSAPTRSETVEKSRNCAAEPKDSLSTPSEFMAVRSIRLAAKDAIARSGDAYREIDTDLKNHAREFERRQEALSSAVESASASLQHLQVRIAKDLTEELEKASQALLTRSAQQLQEQADAAGGALNAKLSAEKHRFVVETEKEFEELRVSRQAFIDDTQKQLAAMTRSALDDLTKAAVEKACAELDASKQGLISERQKELASMGRTSAETLTKELTTDLVEQIRAEVTASRQGFIEDTQSQMAKMTQTFLQELQSLAKSNVEQGRKELSQMVDEFFAKDIPRIEADLKSLVNRRIETVRTQVAHVQITDVSRLTPVQQTPSQGHRLKFTLAESAPKRRIEVADVWAGFSSGMKLGLALGVVVLLMLAIYVSSSPVVRLRVKPPDAFFDESPRLTAKQRAREDHLARAYWDMALRDIETKYGFGSTLPADPPGSFQLEEKDPSGAILKVDVAARARYWEKLRGVWAQSDSWERTSDWNLDWIRNAWHSASSKITQLFSPTHTSTSNAPAP